MVLCLCVWILFRLRVFVINLFICASCAELCFTDLVGLLDLVVGFGCLVGSVACLLGVTVVFGFGVLTRFSL